MIQNHKKGWADLIHEVNGKFTRGTDVFGWLVIRCHPIVTDGCWGDDVTVTVIVTLVARGRFNHHRWDGHLLLRKKEM